MGSFWDQGPMQDFPSTGGGFQQQTPPSSVPDIKFQPQGSYGTINDPRLTTQPQPYQQGPGYTSDTTSQGSLPGGFDQYQASHNNMLGGSQQPQGGQGGDYKTEFMQAVQALGIDPHQLRANPALMDKVSSYLTQKYPGQQWTNGGQKAGDWFSVNGQGFDVLPAGDNNFQWLSDPANSTAGSGGNPNDPSGFQTGTFTGGGQYPLASVMGTGLAQPWTTPFVPPDNLTEQNDPGFQARMKMGTDAIQRSAASRGTLLTGGLLKGLDRYAQDYASNEYGNVYNRAKDMYSTAYGIFNNNQSNLFNRLGQLGSVGENAAAGVGNAQIGAGDARAQGSIAQGNIWGNTINNGVNAGLQYMNQKYGQRPASQNPMELPNGWGGVTMTQPDNG